MISFDALASRVRAFADEHSLASGGTAVLAVSGGADSTAMAALLLQSGLVRDAVLAHFDHRLRGEDAAARDRAAVDALGRRFDVPVVAGAWDAPRPDEASARDARYAFLLATARRHRASVVATGHTFDDQAETVLMHALRGAGLHGLAGIAPSRPWPFAVTDDVVPVLVRPLLALRRDETRALCLALGLAFVDDETNAVPARTRTRIRLELLTRAEAASPAVRATLWRLARDARLAATAIDAAVAHAIVSAHAGAGVVLSRPALATLQRDAAPFAVRLALVRLLGDARDFERRHYALLAGSAAVATGATFMLPRGVVATFDADALLLSVGAPAVPTIAPDVALPLPWSGPIGGWEIEVRRVAGTVSVGGTVFSAPADAVVRGRRPGDRIRLRGHSRKLQDDFVDRKLPRRLRECVPVIASGADVWWTPFAHADLTERGGRYSVRARPREGMAAAGFLDLAGARPR